LESASPRRILVLAHRTAASPPLLDRVRERAAEGPCAFTLLIPQRGRFADAETEDAEQTLELAVPLLQDAAGGPVEGILGDSDPVVAVRETLRKREFDEILVSTLPERVSRWLRRDVPGQIDKLGVPVTVVTAPQTERPVWAANMGPHGFGT
jgi:hypothetical protein